MTQLKFTIAQFNKLFPNDDACLDLLKDLIYPDGVMCRTCNKVRPHHRLRGRKSYSCDYCRTQVYPLAGTVFEKSTTPLKSWFYAMYLYASTRCGISAKQLERELGVSYKTAWRIFSQIRKLMADDTGLLGPEVEIDETYYGARRKRGTPKGRPNPRTSHKTPIFGIVERGGKVAALVTNDVSKRSVMPIIQRKVMPKSLIYTDEYAIYDKLGKQGFTHKRIAHSEQVYVMGNVHVQTIEGFWSLIKRGIAGVHHSVSAKHLQSYVDTYAFRYNHRSDETPMYALIEAQVRNTRHGRYGAYAPLG